VRSLASAVLALEAIVLIMAVPVAIVVYGAPAPLAIAAGVGLIVLAVVAIAGLGRGWGYRLGWAVQVLVLAYALVAWPTVMAPMIVLGAVFVLLWYSALRLARQVEATRPPASPA
jgi:hypothetical protein